VERERRETKLYPPKDLFAFERRNWLYIDHPVGGERNIAELFQTPTGLIFFDVWWYGAHFHPIHEVKGKVQYPGLRENEWWVEYPEYRLIKIMKLTPAKERLWAERMLWEEYKRHEDGKGATRVFARKLLKKWDMI